LLEGFDLDGQAMTIESGYKFDARTL